MSAITQSAKEIIEYRELLLALTYRDIRVKYKQAVMGIAWVIFMPLMAISSGILFRTAMAFVSGKPLELTHVSSVMVKVIPWLMFAAIIGGASNSLVANMNLITKIYFPREIVPLAGVLSALFDFVISTLGLAVVLTIMAMTGGPVVVSWNLLWLPVLLAVLIIMATGMGLILSAANLFFRDVKYIVQVVLQFGIFFSLVYFTYHELGEYGWWLLFNPVAPVLEAIRNVIVGGSIQTYMDGQVADGLMWPFLAYSTVTAVVLLVAGSVIFRRAEYLFAEYV